MSNKGKKRKKQSRRHHTLPQFYLAGFTPSGNKDDRLWVLDLDTGRQWQSGLINVACEKDFYRVATISGKEDSLENLLSGIEGEAAEIIKRITDRKTFPREGSKEYLALMKFIVLLKLRTPKPKKQHDDLAKEIITRVTYLETQSEETWELVKRRLKEKGVDISETTRKEIRNALPGLRIARETYLSTLFPMLNDLLPYYYHRKWSLLITEGSFICSDFPVTISWAHPMPTSRRPGLKFKNTAVIVPLCKRVAMIGTFEQGGRIKFLDEKMLASINGLILYHADRYLYSSEKNFIWLQESEEVKDAKELIRFIKVRRDQP